MACFTRISGISSKLIIPNGRTSVTFDYRDGDNTLVVPIIFSVEFRKLPILVHLLLPNILDLEGVSHTRIHTPVKEVDDIVSAITFGKPHAVSRTEVKLQSERDV